MAKRVTLAVAGSRKTQGIAEHCARLPTTRRVLAITYTQANQHELQARLARHAGDHVNIEVVGWFTFLLRHFARPFLPFKFLGRRLQGFNFEGRPGKFATAHHRFLDSNGAAYGCELARLSFELIAESHQAVIKRLEGIYDEILIDEVQDFSAYDWEILDALLNSKLDLWMVGDVRQAVLSTNARSKKNKAYAYSDAINWFRARAKQGRLEIEESTTTWRCHPTIAAFSDSIFDASWAFPKTESKNERVTEHDGVFLLRTQHVDEYVVRYGPRCLRHSVSSAKKLSLDFLNFKLSKGSTFQRVLIAPTDNIAKFIQLGAVMEPMAASTFYVAVTRAEQSVAIILDKPGKSTLTYWMP